MKKLIGPLVIGISALAFSGATNAADDTKSAKEYAPGQVKPDNSSAKPYAPGQMKKDDESAKDYAPGQQGSDGRSDGSKGIDKSTGSSDPAGKLR